jgi:hypothetical protein
MAWLVSLKIAKTLDTHPVTTLTLSGRRVWKNFCSQIVKGILNARRATKRAVLLKKLVQQGHKVKNQTVYLLTQCKKTNSLPFSGV